MVSVANFYLVFTDFDAHHVELGSMDLGLDADLEDYWQSICKPHKDNSTRLPVDLIPQCISPLSVASENINNSRPLGIASEQTQSLLSTRQHLSNVNNQRSVTDCQNQPSKASAQRDTLIVDKDHSSSSPTTPLLSMKDAKIMTVQRLSQLQTSLLSLLGHAETVSNGTELSDRTLPFELLLSFRHSSGHSGGSDKRSTLTSHDFSKQSSLANHLQGLFAASQTFIMLVKKLQNAALSSLLNADQASISSQTSTPALKQIDPMSRLIVLACYTLLITMYEPFAQILQDQHAALDTIPCCTTNSKIAISKCGIQLDVKTVMLVQLTTYLVNGIDTATREYLWLVSRDPDSTNNHVEASLANGRSRRVSDNIESQDPGEAMCASMKELTVRRDDLRSKLRYCESVHIKSIDQMSL